MSMDFAIQNRIVHIYLELAVLQLTHPAIKSAGILEQSMGARNRVGIGLSYRPSRLHRQAESIPGLLKSLEIPSMQCAQCKVDPKMHEK